MTNKDILVVKADFNDDVEIETLGEDFRKKFGDEVETDKGENKEVYLDAHRNIVVIEFEKLSDGAVLPEYNKEGDVSMNLFAIDCEYDVNTDQYIYHTGLKIKNKPEGIYAYIKPSNSLSDAYLSDYLGFGESEYDGEILIMFKNRTSLAVRRMLEEWRFMKEVTDNYEIDKNMPTGDTINQLKNKKPEGMKEIKPLDYKPYEIGGEIAEVVFVNAPYVKTVEVES